MAWASLLAAPTLHAQALPTVAAASDLKWALEAAAQAYEQRSGNKLRLVFGSSGQFKTQILQGAPFELYLSADEAYVHELTRAGKTVDDGRIYAVGSIGLFVPKASPLRADGKLKDLAAALKDGRLRRLAIANPAHAPYGARAREALQHAGLWTTLQGKLVMGENVAQAAQFATSGHAQAGIIAASLALGPALVQAGQFERIPEGWHQPLRQRMVLIKGSPTPAFQAAQGFYNYLATPEARAVLTQHGFAVPGA